MQWFETKTGQGGSNRGLSPIVFKWAHAGVKKYILMALFLFAALYGGLICAEERVAPEDLQYEDTFTFKHKKTYMIDPWTWGYTKEFAERFHMPQQWVEPNLKGALAIAFRVNSIGATMCGLGGREENCWPAMTCQMDVYYDNRIDLGWGRPDIKQDFFISGVFSYDMLHVLFPQRYKDYIKDEPRIKDILHGKFLEDPTKNKFAVIMGPDYYNKEYQPGVGIISFTKCPDRKGSANLYFYDTEAFHKAIRLREDLISTAKATHMIEIPETFRTRARVAYDRDSKTNRDVIDRLKRQFLESKGIVAPPATP